MKDSPKTALEAAERPFKRMHGCGDHSCVVEKPHGMATNGGCRCLKNDAKMRVIVQRLASMRDHLRREEEQ